MRCFRLLASIVDIFPRPMRMTPQSPPLIPQKTEPILTVSALNQAVARLLEQNIPLTWISGEISNFTRASSGHWYFTLKDAHAQVRAVMFRSRTLYAGFIPKDGDKVEVRANVGLYEARGDFQINVEALRRAGLGSLYEQFLALKNQLAQEGLFDADRKRAIPHFVKHIAIVTSPNAAALRDVLAALTRRAPYCEIRIYPCPVQGDMAGHKIAQALAQADADDWADLIILCRGGGSIEDLWAFNEEVLARTIAHCERPVISGVGHETDFTIADFVADLRAPTPTAAAELAATPRADWLAQLRQEAQRLQQQLRRQLNQKAQHLDWLSQRLTSPKAALSIKRIALEQQVQTLQHALRLPLQNHRHRVWQMHTRLQRYQPETRTHKLGLAHQQQILRSALQTRLQSQKTKLQEYQAQLELLNPQRTLERGYSIVRLANDQVLCSGSELALESEISVQTARDITRLTVKKI